MRIGHPAKLHVSEGPLFTSRINIAPHSHPAKTVAGSVSNVVHVTSWLSRQGGGIPPVVWNLARQTTRSGIDCFVAGLKDRWIKEDCSAQRVPFVTGAIKGPVAFGYSPDLFAQVRSLVKPGGIVHRHGLWMHSGVVARKCARSAGCPLVVSPHGMLEPWALNNSRWKKHLAAALFENRNLRAADCLHALCTAEAESMRRYGLRNPIAIIPNGIELSELYPLPDADVITERFPELKDRRRILFLSRLHPKKGLETLFKAWRRVAPDFSDWCVLIGGAGKPIYEQELRLVVKDFGLEKSVHFLGPIYGREKKQALAAADVFVLPSFSEGFSVAVLEAAAVSLPVVLTRECNFPELEKAGGAIEISTDWQGIEAGLRQILELSDEQRIAMGCRGAELVQKSYTWPAMARKMLNVYQWLAGSGPRPEVVKVG